MASNPDSGSITRPPAITTSRTAASTWELGAAAEEIPSLASKITEVRKIAALRILIRYFPQD
jgi:hypothetical protein